MGVTAPVLLLNQVYSCWQPALSINSDRSTQLSHLYHIFWHWGSGCKISHDTLRDSWVAFWRFWVGFITSAKEVMFLPAFIYLFVSKIIKKFWTIWVYICEETSCLALVCIIPHTRVPVKLTTNLWKVHHTILSVKWPLSCPARPFIDRDFAIFSYCFSFTFVCLFATNPPIHLHSTFLLTFIIQ